MLSNLQSLLLLSPGYRPKKTFLLVDVGERSSISRLPLLPYALHHLSRLCKRMSLIIIELSSNEWFISSFGLNAQCVCKYTECFESSNISELFFHKTGGLPTFWLFQGHSRDTGKRRSRRNLPFLSQEMIAWIPSPCPLLSYRPYLKTDIIIPTIAAHGNRLKALTNFPDSNKK